MKSFWKIATPIACVVLLCGAAFIWHTYKAKLNEQKLAEDARACRVRAEQGNAKAEYDLSQMYYHGLGVPQDYAETLRWCRKAADQGYAAADYGIGYLYYNGQGVPQNYAEALVWYRKAADQGDLNAEYSVGYMDELGRGMPQNYAEALVWYRKAADRGDAKAQCGLASMYFHGRGVQQDRAEAARWYRKSADRGLAKAQYDIGYMYYYGQGVPQDRAEANHWLQKAASQGDKYALSWLCEGLTTFRIFNLGAQSLLGILLTLNFLSLNLWELGSSLRGFRQRMITGTGLVCLFSAAFSWYGYSHFLIRRLSYGLNVFTCFKWLLNAGMVALLFYIVLSGKKPGGEEGETAAEDGSVGNDTEQ